MPEAGPVLLRGVDRAAFATALSRRLRSAGVDVGLTATESLTRSLGLQPLDSVSRVYWFARLTLVRREADLEIFDTVWSEVFAQLSAAKSQSARRDVGRHSLPPSAGKLRQPGSSRTNQGVPWATLTPVRASPDPRLAEHAVSDLLPSELEVLAEEPFDQLDDADLALLTAWMADARTRWPRRRTRRERVQSNGHRIAMRQTMERSRMTGWEQVHLVRTKPLHQPRRLIIVCDLSQSMQAYARPYLQLMRAGAVGAESEVFAFGTTLTRLTVALRHTSTDMAIADATDKVTDRFGGTRIATNLTALLRSRYGTLVRGAIVVIASDGWDSDPPEMLGKAMERLSRRAHRVVWLNPRSASPGFEPKVASMAAALPYCDDFRSAHSLSGLREVMESLTT